MNLGHRTSDVRPGSGGQRLSSIASLGKLRPRVSLEFTKVSLELMADLNLGGLSCHCTHFTAYIPAAISLLSSLPCPVLFSCPLATEIINQAHLNPELS